MTVEKTVGAVTVEEQVKALLATAHLPLLEVRVKPDPDAAAVNVAQVPVVYQVPPLIIQPLTVPPLVTGSVPLPEKGPPGVGVEVGGVPVEVVMVVEGGVPVLGRYFTPVAEQLDLDPSEASQKEPREYHDRCLPGSAGTKVPVCTLPLTSKKYHISSRAPLLHWIDTWTPLGLARAAKISADV